MLVLLGVVAIAAGFLLRFNPLLVVAVSAAVTGWAAGIAPLGILQRFGHAFAETRYVSAIYLVLPVIGLLERHGLRERARSVVEGLRGLTAGRLLLGYLALRQVSAALGLVAIAGPAQTVRPLLAPMATAAAERQSEAGGEPDGAADGEAIRALAAATDNVGVFFGEDIFLAIGSVLLMKGVVDGYGYHLEPLSLSLWAIPTAVAAFLIHGTRLMLLDRRLARRRG